MNITLLREEKTQGGQREMKIALILKIVGTLYNYGFRELLIKFIKDPKNKWDDDLIAGLDSFFGYKKKV